MSGNDHANGMNALAGGLNPLEVFSRIGRLPIVGRAFQQRVLEEMVDDVAGGRGRVILLSGEAGSGKSRLIQEVLRIARDRDGRTLHAECLVEAGAPPYDVWIRALRGFPDSTAVLLLEGTELPEGAIPYSSWRPRRMTVAETRFRLHTDVLGALERTSKRQPVVITLDDLQWADPSTLQLFRFVAHRAEASSLALVGAFRSEEALPDSELSQIVDDLQASHKAIRLNVSPFSPQETEAVVEALLGQPARSMSAALHERSDGNPFVLEETIRLLASSGELSVDPESIARRKLPIPPGVAASIRMRIDRLSAGERASLETAAVAGKRFDAGAVAAALNLDPETAEQVLDRLTHLSMLRREEEAPPGTGIFAFLHDRFREVVLDSISPARRKTLHLTFATVLEQTPGSRNDPDQISALANHYRIAAEPETAAGYFRQLGELSMNRHAPEEAAVAFQAAIDLQRQLPGVPKGLAPLEMSLGTALFVAGKRGAAEAFARAREEYCLEGRLDLAGMAADQQGLALASDEQHELALATYQSALDLLAGGSENRRRASVLLHMSETLGPSLARFDDAMRAQRQAMSLLDPNDAHDPLRSLASLALARTLMRMNRLEDAQEVLEQALPATIRMGEPGIAADLEGARANVTYWRGDVRQSRICTLQRQAFAQAAGDVFNTRHINSWLAHLELTLGNWREAERLLGEAERDVSGFDSPEPLAFTQQIRGHLAFTRGDYALACECMLDSLEAFRQMGAATVSWYIGYAARSSYAAGNRDASEALVNEAWIALEDLPGNALSKGASLTELAFLAVEAGEHEQCERLYEALLPYSGELHWQLVDRALGMAAAALSRQALARSHFDQAIAISRQFGLRPEHALAVAARARLTGDDLEQPIARLRSMGMTGDARQLAAYAGWSESSGQQSKPANLTGREVEVLRLVAAGLTNKQIAFRLGIADKTVTNHITHIFDKADLENRAAAAAFAVRHRLD